MKKKPWKRLSQSDSEAVMRLVDEYQSSIKRIIVSVLKGQWPDAVDDILQDTYEEICRQLNLIEEAENRRAYVCKIAARLAIQAHRKSGSSVGRRRPCTGGFILQPGYDSTLQPISIR